MPAAHWRLDGSKRKINEDLGAWQNEHTVSLSKKSHKIGIFFFYFSKASLTIILFNPFLTHYVHCFLDNQDKDVCHMPPLQTFTKIAGNTISKRHIRFPDCGFQNICVVEPKFGERSHFGKIISLEKSGFKPIYTSTVKCEIDMEGRIMNHLSDFFSYRYEFPLVQAENFLSLEWKRVLSILPHKKEKMYEIVCTLRIDEFQDDKKNPGGMKSENREKGIILAAKYSFSYCQEGAITLEENNATLRRGFVDTSHYYRGNLASNSLIGTIIICLSCGVSLIAKKAAAEFLKAGVMNVALILPWGYPEKPHNENE